MFQCFNYPRRELGRRIENFGYYLMLQVYSFNNMAESTLKGGTHVLPNAEDLKMSQTVQNHMNDVIKKGPNAGQLSRP